LRANISRYNMRLARRWKCGLTVRIFLLSDGTKLHFQTLM
jgi:hypothetical protein